MSAIRVIPLILYDGYQAIKTVKFGSPRNVGHIMNVIRVHVRRGVDELVLLDVRHGAPPPFELVEQIAQEVFVPFAVGGGVQGVEDAKTLLRLGADKVVVSVSAGQGPLIRSISAALGAQAVIGCVDAHTNPAAEWFAKAAEIGGAGEILLQAIDKDGTLGGFDLDMSKVVCEGTHLPVIVAGGGRNGQDAINAVAAGASAVAFGSAFAFTEVTPSGVKSELRHAGYEVRTNEVPLPLDANVDGLDWQV